MTDQRTPTRPPADRLFRQRAARALNRGAVIRHELNEVLRDLRGIVSRAGRNLKHGDDTDPPPV